MTKLSPPRYSEEQQGIYHTQTDCESYKKITKENEQKGMPPGRRKCKFCEEIEVRGIIVSSRS